MSEIPFFKTVMGHRFFEGDVPALLRQLEKLTANLERIANALEVLTNTIPPPPSEE